MVGAYLPRLFQFFIETCHLLFAYNRVTKGVSECLPLRANNI